jgi:hypothetical protein
MPIITWRIILIFLILCVTIGYWFLVFHCKECNFLDPIQSIESLLSIIALIIAIWNWELIKGFFSHDFIHKFNMNSEIQFDKILSFVFYSGLLKEQETFYGAVDNKNKKNWIKIYCSKYRFDVDNFFIVEKNRGSTFQEQLLINISKSIAKKWNEETISVIQIKTIDKVVVLSGSDIVEDNFDYFFAFLAKSLNIQKSQIELYNGLENLIAHDGPIEFLEKDNNQNVLIIRLFDLFRDDLLIPKLEERGYTILGDYAIFGEKGRPKSDVKHKSIYSRFVFISLDLKSYFKKMKI